VNRAEAAGFGVATAGHLALLAALSLGFAATRIVPPKQQPIEVSFIEEAAPVSSAPEPSQTPPAPKLAEVPGPPEPVASPAPPTPAPPVAHPLPAPPRRQPVPAAPAPAPVAHRPSLAKPAPAPPQPKPAPPHPQTRPTGRLSGLLAGLSDTASNSRSTAAPAATASPALRSALQAEILRQLRPQWHKVAPSGADVESLRTNLTLSFGRDGSVTHIEVTGTTGVTASNRPQVPLHQERAKKAVTLASPFRLPAEFYDAWKQVTVTLDLRLSQ
jgi:outer membrane biosynthesis protein TonB